MTPPSTTPPPASVKSHSSMTQNAGVAIDECDFTDAGGGVVEGGVIAHHAEFFGVHLDLAEVGSADGAMGYRKFVGLAGAIVGHGQRFAERGGTFRIFRLRRGQRRVPRS